MQREVHFECWGKGYLGFDDLKLQKFPGGFRFCVIKRRMWSGTQNFNCYSVIIYRTRKTCVTVRGVSPML